ncbi:MAG: substrate-binding domain-containing protein [Chloroflexota bacterium]|nr:substrate-binding domain-containing protein [Chloroflexota bacterium]MDE2895771.1 substrate-binding domain-containing protein [Chloroflexota bacterium]
MTDTWKRVIDTRHRAWLIAIAAIGAVIVGMMIQRYVPGLGHAGASDAQGDAPVRVVVVKLADGRVEVGVQAQQPDGGWGEVIRPSARFLRVDAPVERRLHSSAVSVPAYYPVPESMEELLAGTEGYFRESPLYCVINHGAAEDFFWSAANNRTVQSGRLGRDNIRIFSSPDGAKQAAAIRDCTADGAVAVAATLADPAAVAGALREAATSGVHVLTYNSGAEVSRSVGAYAHLGLDDPRAGELAGEWLNRQGIIGDVHCLLHEQRNVGLTQRCSGLASTYRGGQVQEVDISEGIDELAARLASTDAAVLVALNVNNTSAVANALVASGRGDITLIGFGGGPSILGPLLSGILAMLVWDQPDLQGHIAAHLLTLPEQLHTGLPALELGSPFIAIEPVIYDAQTVQAFLAQLPPEVVEAISRAARGG